MVDKMLQWFTDRQGKVTYSMAYRNGPGSYDCSSSVYYALIQGSYLSQGTWIGNTDSLYRDLEKNGWAEVTPPLQRGDIFLWGKRGASTGALGHTGAFVDGSRIIHCSYGYNGIHVDDHDWLWQLNGSPEYTFYRYTGAPKPTPVNVIDQNVDIGSTIKFDTTYTVDDMQNFAGDWQVKSNLLCPIDFSWEHNGLPVAMLTEVDKDGYATADQDLDVGSKFKIAGKFVIQDIGEQNGVWFALIEHNGLKMWVDVATAIEISDSDAGTPVPRSKPVEAPKTPKPVSEPPKTALDAIKNFFGIHSPSRVMAQMGTFIGQGLANGIAGTQDLVGGVVNDLASTVTDGLSASPSMTMTANAGLTGAAEPPTQPIIEQPAPIEQPTKPQAPTKEVPMAFSQEQQQQLAVQTQQVVAASDFVPVISDKVKTRAYFITDNAATATGLILSVMAIVKLIDGTIAIMLNGVIVAALLHTKQTFRISNKKS